MRDRCLHCLRSTVLCAIAATSTHISERRIIYGKQDKAELTSTMAVMCIPRTSLYCLNCAYLVTTLMRTNEIKCLYSTVGCRLNHTLLFDHSSIQIVDVAYFLFSYLAIFSSLRHVVGN